MKAIDGYFLIKPEDLLWRPSNLMKIPNADFLERTNSEILGARLWRLPSKSANTLHRHPKWKNFILLSKVSDAFVSGIKPSPFQSTEESWLGLKRCARYSM